MQKSLCTNTLGDNRTLPIALSFAHCVDALASMVQPGIRESRGRRVGELVALHPGAGSVPGNAPAVTESIRFTGPAFALRLWWVT